MQRVLQGLARAANSPVNGLAAGGGHGKSFLNEVYQTVWNCAVRASLFFANEDLAAMIDACPASGKFGGSRGEMWAVTEYYGGKEWLRKIRCRCSN
jgi:hypothetical protein